MKPVSAIFIFLFTVYGGLFFMLTMVIVFPFYYVVFIFTGKRALHYAQHITRTWARVVFFFLLIRFRIKNKELIDRQQTFVFISNHQSLLDLPAYALSCGNTLRFLAKEELTKIPVIGFVIKRLYLWVKREDKADRKRSMSAMMESLREHVSVFLCVEGTRNKTDAPLLEFRDGAFVLAIESQLPIAVLTVMNTKKLLPPTGFFKLSPGTIHAKWESPIPTLGLTEEDIPELKQRARSLMLNNVNYFMEHKRF